MDTTLALEEKRQSTLPPVSPYERTIVLRALQFFADSGELGASTLGRYTTDLPRMLRLPSARMMRISISPKLRNVCRD
jgi:hypothetical protein